MLYLHCGWARTGTTSLQAALFEHRDALAAAGTVFPERWMTLAGPTHYGVVEMLKASQRSANALDELWSFLAANADRDVLLSAESITAWLLEEGRQEALLAFLAKAREVTPTRCIWTLRPLEDALTSLYLRRLSLGVDLAPPAEAIGAFREPDHLFGGMRKVDEVAADVVYVEYDAAGAHNDRLLSAFEIADDVAVEIRARLEREPRRNVSLSHKQSAALLNVDAISARAGVDFNRDALRAAFAPGGFEFEHDRRCELVDDATRQRLRERVLTAARRQSFSPYVDFFGDAPLRRARSAPPAPETLTDEDLGRLAAAVLEGDLASPSALDAGGRS